MDFLLFFLKKKKMEKKKKKKENQTIEQFAQVEVEKKV